MSRAIFCKTLRDSWLLIGALILAVLVLELGILRMLLETGENLEHLRTWLELPLVRDLLQIVLGADLVGDLTPTTMATFGLAHPLLYAFAWILLIAMGSAAIAGEIDWGTADWLLTLPVSRATVYFSTSAACLLAAVGIGCAPLVGLWLGVQLWPRAGPLDFGRLWPLTPNFVALNVCVAGLALLASSLVARRGKAVGLVLACLLVSDLVNILTQFWAVLRPIKFLGFLHYYRPLPVVRSGELPWANIAILLGVAAIAWLAGLRCFCRRDIPAV